LIGQRIEIAEQSGQFIHLGPPSRVVRGGAHAGDDRDSGSRKAGEPKKEGEVVLLGVGERPGQEDGQRGDRVG